MSAPATARTYDYEIILVTYHSRALLEGLLTRLPADVPMVVVDNAQGADGIGDLVRGRTAVRYLHGPNRGFGAAANLGIRTSRFDKVITLNPDCAPKVEQLDRLAAELDTDPRLAQVALTTTLPGGEVEIGVGGWEPTVGRAVVHAVGAHKLFPTRGLWATPEPGRPIEIDWLGGACMVVPRPVFEMLGGYDESYYVYNEDVEFSRKAREAGFRQTILTDVLVPHLGAGSGQAKTVMLQMRGAMMQKYVARHNGRFTAEGFRIALSAGFVARYLLCRILGHQAVAQERAAYVRGLWVGPPDMS